MSIQQQRGISRKWYLQLDPPTEEDNRSCQKRILDEVTQRLKESGEENHPVSMSLQVQRKLYPLCDQADWKVTVCVAWDGWVWRILGIEPGDTTESHYGLAIDLGSTTVVGQLFCCADGTVLAETSAFNRQIRFGTDILSRIFYSKDQPEHLEEIRHETVMSICQVIEELEKKAGVFHGSCVQMVVGGNTTMIHFLLGLDAFCVFSTPYAVRADDPGFILGRELGLPVAGYVYCCPGRSNYIGGDIISGMIATGLYKEEKICAFFDIGTNGELVIGNRDFLLCGAGAAGPALEGGVVRTGMKADCGAVDHVHILKDHFENHVIGEGQAKGICGSGIVDLIAQLFLHGWIDLRGRFVPEKSRLISMRETVVEDGKEQDAYAAGTDALLTGQEHQAESKPGESSLDEKTVIRQYAVEYEPGLYFYQDDIREFIRTKSAAYTMVEYILKESGILPEELRKFYVCGAFGRHVSKESAITIGRYPDMNREGIIHAGNTSLEGAAKLLLHKELFLDIDEIMEKMTYIQFGAVEDFLGMMEAAQFLPHIDLERFPTVKKRLEEMAKEG